MPIKINKVPGRLPRPPGPKRKIAPTIRPGPRPHLGPAVQQNFRENRGANSEAKQMQACHLNEIKRPKTNKSPCTANTWLARGRGSDPSFRRLCRVTRWTCPTLPDCLMQPQGSSEQCPTGPSASLETLGTLPEHARYYPSKPVAWPRVVAHHRNGYASSFDGRNVAPQNI